MKEIISYNDPKSVISEQYRALRTSIQYSNVDKNMKTILVTSSDKNEGKTTTVVNLAVNFANLDKKVLLIDCDLRNPSIHKMFKMGNIYGFTDILVQNKTAFIDLKNARHPLIDQSKVIYGGKGCNLRIEPTIMDNVTYDDAVMQEEIFGPIFPIMSFKDIDEIAEQLKRGDTE